MHWPFGSSPELRELMHYFTVFLYEKKQSAANSAQESDGKQGGGNLQLIEKAKYR